MAIQVSMYLPQSKHQNYSYADIFPNFNEIKQLNFSLQFYLIDK